MLTTVYTKQNILLRKKGDVASASPENRQAVNWMSTNIRKFRSALMLTQEEFGRVIGVERSNIAHVENGDWSAREITFEFTNVNGFQLIRLCVFARLFVESNMSQLAFGLKVGLIQRDVSHYLAAKKPISSKNWQRLTAVYGPVKPNESDLKRAVLLYQQRMA